MMNDIQREHYYLLGYEIDSRIVMECDDTEVADMFRELADILDDIGVERGDRLQSFSCTYSGIDDRKVANFKVMLRKAPRK